MMEEIEKMTLIGKLWELGFDKTCCTFTWPLCTAVNIVSQRFLAENHLNFVLSCNLLAPCKQIATGSGRRNKKVTLNRDQISGHLTRLSCPLDQEEKTGPGTHTHRAQGAPSVCRVSGRCLPVSHKVPSVSHREPSVLSRCLVHGCHKHYF